MTTGLIFSILFYLISLILTAVGWFAFTGGDAMRTFDALATVAKIIGPALIAPAGFVLGFFRETRINRRKRSKADFDAQEAMLHRDADKPKAKKPEAEAPPKVQRERQMPDEVRDYLRKTSHVDTQGIKDFLKETRSHHLEELRAAMEKEQRKG